MADTLYRLLAGFHQRPAPFSRTTIADLWTDDHISAQMLAHHLDPDDDLASRRPDKIAAIAGWLDDVLSLPGKAVTDLGCGPGLYATELTRRGAHVTGLDFSGRSLAHARQAAAEAGLAIAYVHADYLADALPARQDAVLLIYGDLCALSPDQRRLLYGKVRASLAVGGRFVFDVSSVPQYRLREESASFARNLMGGFWAASDYVGLSKTFLYDDLKLALDRYLIVAADRTFEIFNWLQYFDPDTIAAELADAGFDVERIVDAITGKPWDGGPSEFAVVAKAG